MSHNYIISGTDTDIGKTVVSAMLMAGLNKVGRNVSYWKPVQSGLDGLVDTRSVQKYSGLDDSHFLQEAYVLTEPLSPHRSAEIDGVEIDLEALALPEVDGTLLIEGAGGLMVPLTRKALLINQFKKWNAPVILVARTALGTINHTLLSLEALWARDIPVHGLIFVGEENEDNIRTIAEISGERVLGHVPMLDEITPDALLKVFADNFSVEDFCLPERKAAGL